MKMEILRWGRTFETLRIQDIHRADNGATIFLKLWQVDIDNPHQMSVGRLKAHLSPIQRRADAFSVDLYSDDRKSVCVEIRDTDSH